jgi:hypothetical protein
MKKLLLILLCMPIMTLAQQTYVPDDSFEFTLINLGYDNIMDNYVLTSNINTIDSLDISWASISDLTGIEDFNDLTYLNCLGNYLSILDMSANSFLSSLNCYDNELTLLDISQNTVLTELYCNNNQLTSLDVSQNTALTYLNCYNNQLTSLDVSQNTALTSLICSYNQLLSLDISQNTVLTELYCYDNQLSLLDLSQNTALTHLNCKYNQLVCLDISNNNVLTKLICTYNLLEQLNTKNGNWLNVEIYYAANNNLSCVEVDDIAHATANWSTTFDNTVTFSANCNYANPCNSFTTVTDYGIEKVLIKITDVLGRNAKETKNTPFFYIYEDGTVEKRIVIE